MFFSQNCLETPWIFQPALLEHGAVKHKIMHFRSHGAVNDTIFVNALSLEGTPTNQCGPLTPYHHPPPWDLGSIAELSQTPSQQILFKSQHVNIFSKVGNPGSCPVSSSPPTPTCYRCLIIPQLSPADQGCPVLVQQEAGETVLAMASYGELGAAIDIKSN